MSERITVEAEWDEEAGVWIAAAPTIGLFTQAPTLDGLKERVVSIAADLLGDGTTFVDVSIALSVAVDQRVAAAA